MSHEKEKVHWDFKRTSGYPLQYGGHQADE